MHEESWVGDPERDEKVKRNRANRARRIALSAEHYEGKHESAKDGCVECELVKGLQTG